MNSNLPQPSYEDLVQIITNQKKEISELNKKSARVANFEFYLKESEDLLCIAGIDGFYKEVNPAFLKIIGYTKQELLSVSLISFIHPDDRLKTNLEIERLSQGQFSTSFENRYLTKRVLL